MLDRDGMRGPVIGRTTSQKVAAAALALLLSLGGCDGGAPDAPDVDKQRPRATWEDCTLGSSRCAMISEAISGLESHDDGWCRVLGSSARDRFNATGYGFRPASTSGFPPQPYDMYVIMQFDPSYDSGYGPTDKNTYVEDVAFTRSTGQMSGVIAHDETHQAGSDNLNHTTGVAEEARDRCTIG
jgi:hypothetical protein